MIAKFAGSVSHLDTGGCDYASLVIPGSLGTTAIQVWRTSRLGHSCVAISEADPSVTIWRSHPRPPRQARGGGWVSSTAAGELGVVGESRRQIADPGGRRGLEPPGRITGGEVYSVRSARQCPPDDAQIRGAPSGCSGPADQPQPLYRIGDAIGDDPHPKVSPARRASEPSRCCRSASKAARASTPARVRRHARAWCWRWLYAPSPSC